MMEWTFVLVLHTEGRALDYELVDRLLGAGCDDATFSVRDGVAFGDFDRVAGSAAEAIWSAVADIESADGVSVAHAEPSDFVTAAQIAERVGRSRESIRLLAGGQRGSSSDMFPLPMSGVSGKSRLWSWVEVAHWFGRNRPDELPAHQIELADALKAVNQSLSYARQFGKKADLPTWMGQLVKHSMTPLLKWTPTHNEQTIRLTSLEHATSMVALYSDVIHNDRLSEVIIKALNSKNDEVEFAVNLSAEPDLFYDKAQAQGPGAVVDVS
jgi:hypothetical protein